ncbi:pseudouridine synthase [Microbulbifer sp. 2205BS26-8]|uniref:pseudouridine synthase n=1 Tax=Microbulbifer sp. 2205BS26-8 TaxID=3064386 RepID=UPI00273E5B80|nr:pseudouridine synthase [Microbulbifer sp. 2205BS26-8]MDP5208939.1 pseudouridine synthase [Microbulbifer sp. 2205BS26-8]
MAMLILLNKPYGVLSQFTDSQGRPTLADYVRKKDIYPAGRLDFDSEGLLLTADGALQHQISHPKKKVAKTYWVQVEGKISADALTALDRGVLLKEGRTAPARTRRLSDVKLWSRTPPIRERKSIPTSWLELTICEGRNRQVRRMTAAVGFPTLRLVRMAIGRWHLGALKPGEYRIEEIFTVNQAPSKPGQKRIPPQRQRQVLAENPSGLGPRRFHR